MGEEEETLKKGPQNTQHTSKVTPKAAGGAAWGPRVASPGTERSHWGGSITDNFIEVRAKLEEALQCLKNKINKKNLGVKASNEAVALEI